MHKEDYNFKKLVSLIKLEAREITAIYFYAILNGLIQLILPLGIQSILGFVLGATMVASVYLLIALIILAVLFVGILQINQMKVIEKIQQKIFVRYTLEYTEKIPALDLKEVGHLYLPEKINQFFDTANVQKGISKLLLDIPIALIQILFGMILLAFYHPYFIILSLLLILIVGFILKYTSRKGLKTSIQESDNKYKVAGWLEEIGRVIQSFKYSQGTNLNLINTDKRLVKYLHARTSHFKVLLVQFKTLVFFKICITATMLILGTYLLFNQKINIGQFVAAEIVILTIINALEKLIVSLENIYDVATGLYKLDSLLELPAEKGGSHELNADTLQIDIKNMEFAYSKNYSVLSNVTLSILPNAITCISGNENSGKTTLLKLFTCGYSDFKGSINFNQIPLQNYSLQSLRSKTGMLLHEQELFDGTIYENITLGREDITIDEIIELSEKLGFNNFFTIFPNSFNTNIHELRKTFHSSLIIKILLLRALIHNPILIVLEEPWAGLDEDISINIQNYLLEIAKSRTIVISTNENQFIQKCAHHIHLSNGQATIKK